MTYLLRKELDRIPVRPKDMIELSLVHHLDEGFIADSGMRTVMDAESFSECMKRALRVLKERSGALYNGRFASITRKRHQTWCHIGLHPQT